MAIETWQAIGHGSQNGLYAFLPALLLLPFYLISGRAQREGVFGFSRFAWRGVRGLEHACLFAFAIGILGATVGEFPCAAIKARSTACMSNEKQLGLALLQYVQDWSEVYPPAVRWGDLVTSHPGAHLTREMLRCPSSESAYGYALNAALDRLAQADVDYPVATVSLFEADAATQNVSGGREALSRKARHSGGRYYCFADGHVKSAWGANEAALNWQARAPSSSKGNP